ncbi:MAG TPA: hypothetical protein VGC22_12005 [Chitinophaga sp.]
MKTAFFLSLFLAMASPQAALAQQDSVSGKRWSVEGRADKMSDKLRRELKLTHAQDSQILAINTDIIRRADHVKHSATLSQKEKMQQLQELDAERNQRFKTVLSAAQYRQFNNWNMQQKARLEAKMDRKAAAKQKPSPAGPGN